MAFVAFVLCWIFSRAEADAIGPGWLIQRTGNADDVRKRGLHGHCCGMAWWLLQKAANSEHAFFGLFTFIQYSLNDSH
jgi:hypothetical protein